MEPEKLTAWLAAATSPTSDPLLDWLSRGGALGVLAFVAVGFVRGWIVPGREVERLIQEMALIRAEKDRALDLVYNTADTASKAVAALSEFQERLRHRDH